MRALSVPVKPVSAAIGIMGMLMVSGPSPAFPAEGGRTTATPCGQSDLDAGGIRC